MKSGVGVPRCPRRDTTRPCALDWIRSVVAQCRAAGVPVFVKQLGARPVGAPIPLRHKKGGDPNEWPADLADLRQFPAAWRGAA